MDKYSFQIRVTGILIENNQLLLVKQRVSPGRAWSLPGGRVEAGETLDEAIKREMLEETGLEIKVEKLLYVCDKTDCDPPILHITFLLSKAGGKMLLPTNAFDNNPISDIKFVDFRDLMDLGFTEKFAHIVKNGFPYSGSYMGLKENIGL